MGRITSIGFMKAISWVEVSKAVSGGVTYNKQARDTLSQEFDVELVNVEAQWFTAFRPLKFLESMTRLLLLKGRRDVWVRNFFATLTMPVDRTEGRQITLSHHADSSGFPLMSRPLFLIFKKIFERNLKKLDALVVVSRYWKDHFVQKGFSNVHLIYNGFDISEFQISEGEVADFREKYQLEGKPIIYLGNCQKAKGVDKSWRALQNMEAHLVTSGRRRVYIPAQNFELEYRDYLKLLKASSVVLTMSTIREGWCRTAHEAMLLKTPVIGSGRGGMQELLEGGGQVTCEDIHMLKGLVEDLLEHEEKRRRMGEEGYAFAKTFTIERFQKEWITLINSLV